MKLSVHIEAPVEKVFDFFTDPRNEWDILALPFAFKDVKLAKEGVGTYYSWVSKTPVLRLEGFYVFTEFVPNQRITERSSLAMDGDSALSFEPEGSGMRLTIENHPRSFWRIPPLKQLAGWAQSTAFRRLTSALKATMEA